MLHLLEGICSAGRQLFVDFDIFTLTAQVDAVVASVLLGD
jgi:hypothetical protein